MQPLSSLHRRAAVTGVSLICIFVTLYTIFLGRDQHPGTIFQDPYLDYTPSTKETVADGGSNSPSVAAPGASFDWLVSHNFTYPIKYSFRSIVARETSGLRREAITKVDSPLFEGKVKVLDSIESLRAQKESRSNPLILDVPLVPGSGPANAESVMFGIQTTILRLEDSIPHLLRWLANTKARLFVVLKESETVSVNKKDMKSLETRLRGLGLDASLFPARDYHVFPQRYFSLIHLMYKHRLPETQWISLVDDDTFFPSMPALLKMLGRHDAKEQYYIGGLSEDWWAVNTYGFMAFGGAGMFLSVPLAKALDEHSEDCMKDLASSAGDITVQHCIYTHTATKLTPIPGLHQADMQGDLSGFYESGRAFLSLHHWKEGSDFGNALDVPSMHLVSDICGECFLQRWQFDESMVLTNAFSIASYPHSRSSSKGELDMIKTEHTWNTNMDVKHSLGPTRPRLELEREKIQYRILDSVAVDGGVRQLYLHKGVEGDSDTVLELFWTKEGPP